VKFVGLEEPPITWWGCPRRRTASGRLPASFPVADGVLPVAHDERLETVRGYREHERPAGLPSGSGAHPSVATGVREASWAVSAEEFGNGGTVKAAVDVTAVDVTDVGAAPLSAAVPLYGRRHELGVRPRRRSLLAVRRTTCAPGTGTTVEFELGSWERGRPIAVPVEVGVWSSDDTDEEGRTPWQR
jgi:beta-glucosidase